MLLMVYEIETSEIWYKHHHYQQQQYKQAHKSHRIAINLPCQKITAVKMIGQIKNIPIFIPYNIRIITIELAYQLTAIVYKHNKCSVNRMAMRYKHGQHWLAGIISMYTINNDFQHTYTPVYIFYLCKGNIQLISLRMSKKKTRTTTTTTTFHWTI